MGPWALLLAEHGSYTQIFFWTWGSGLVVGLVQTGTMTLMTPQAFERGGAGPLAVELASLQSALFHLLSHLSACLCESTGLKLHCLGVERTWQCSQEAGPPGEAPG